MEMKPMKLTLKAWRTNKGLKQSDVAKIIDVSESTIIKWESGKSYPNAKQIEKLCDLYNTSFDNIIFF